MRGLTFWKKVKLGAIEQRWIAEILIFNYSIKHSQKKANCNGSYLSKYLTEVPRDLDEDDIANICHVSPAPVPA